MKFADTTEVQVFTAIMDKWIAENIPTKYVLADNFASVSSMNPSHIWTEVDEDEYCVITAGFIDASQNHHSVMGYYVVDIPWVEGADPVITSKDYYCPDCEGSGLDEEEDECASCEGDAVEWVEFDTVDRT